MQINKSKAFAFNDIALSKEEAEGKWFYETHQDGSIEICNYKGRLNNVVVPSIIDGYRVTKITSFEYCSLLTRVSIPGCVTTIEADAFEHCPNLQVIIALNVPISVFCASILKVLAVCGFAEVYASGANVVSQEIREGYLRYIRSQRKRLYDKAVDNGALIELMMTEGIIPERDFDDVQEKLRSKTTSLICQHSWITRIRTQSQRMSKGSFRKNFRVKFDRLKKVHIHLLRQGKTGFFATSMTTLL